MNRKGIRAGIVYGRGGLIALYTVVGRGSIVWRYSRFTNVGIHNVGIHDVGIRNAV